MTTTKKVHIDELKRIVVILANQTPVRYVLDANQDGSFSKVGLEVWRRKEEPFPEQLSKELEATGFWRVRDGATGDMCYTYWEAVREK